MATADATPRPAEPAFRITDAAREVGVSPSAIRLWERQGLIRPEREPSGARRYSAIDIERLRTIHRLRHADGLNAAAILRLLPPGLTTRPLSGVAPLDAISRDPRLATVPSQWTSDVGGDGAARVAEEAVRTPLSSVPPAIDAGSEAPSTAASGSTPPVGQAFRRRALDGAGSDRTTNLGTALRAARLARRLTLREAAAAAGLSPSFVSGLERGVTGASLATLKRLTGVYGTTVAGLVRGGGVGEGRLVRAVERRVAEPGEGIRIEDLATAPTQLESQLFVLAPGASSDGYYAHPGEEFMFVLDGRLAVWLDEAEYYELGPGDALTFPSTLDHRFRALGGKETRLLWVNTPPTF